MPRRRPVNVRCPICKKQVKVSGPEFPFCSQRCRTIDLGKWASGDYVIASALKDSEERFQEKGEASEDE
jgi:uncharacterized protein